MENQTLKECSINSCTDSTIARGFCQNHYRRWLRHGDAERVIKMRYSLNDFVVDSITNCKIWSGSKDGSGYSKKMIDGEYVRVHRLHANRV